MRKLSLIVPAFLATALASTAMAALNPTFSYHITGSTTLSSQGLLSSEFASTNFIVNYPASGQGTGGGLDFSTNDPAIDIDRPELFSDPVWAPNDLKYSNLGNWGYFSVLQRTGLDEQALPTRLVFASKPLSDAQRDFDNLFAPFLTANPTWDYFRVRQAVLDGPDINGGGGNNPDYFTVADFLNNAPFLGNIGTTFQSADTLTVYMFVTDGEGPVIAQPVGDLTVNANVIPEPAALGLLAPAALLLKRRR